MTYNVLSLSGKQNQTNKAMTITIKNEGKLSNLTIKKDDKKIVHWDKLSREDKNIILNTLQDWFLLLNLHSK